MLRNVRTYIASLILAASSIGAFTAAFGEESATAGLTLAKHLRRPVAVIATDECLLVGNRRSGTLTVIGPADHRIIAEHSVAARIADLAELNRKRDILVLDDEDCRLLKVSLASGRASVKSIARVPRAASKLCVAAERRQVFVTATWPRQVSAISFDDEFENATQIKSTSLPFAPRDLILLDGHQTLLVADAFGGQIAVVDVAQMKLQGVRRLAGHNIRGLAVSADGKQLHVSHQQMTRDARADYEELHWGRLIANGVQVFDVQRFLAAESGQFVDGWLDTHGGIGGAAGDPAGVITGPDRSSAVALSGVGEVAVRHGGYAKRITVGSRPEAMAFAFDRLYVANRFDDSVSVIDLDRGELETTIHLGPAPDLTAVQRGEKLFYDATLAHDNWMSCHSCHTDGHSSGLVVDTLGDGDYGAPKRVPSLLGTGKTGPWGWTGRMASLGDQVRSSVTTTMHGEEIDRFQTSDLVAFLESLHAPPPPSHENRALTGRGRAVFETRGCVDCHTSPEFTSKGTFDVGLADERNRRLFNPPSLRGVSQRDRLFHDGRASSLEDVLLRFRHELREPLSREHSTALLAYLRSL